MSKHMKFRQGLAAMVLVASVFNLMTSEQEQNEQGMLDKAPKSRSQVHSSGRKLLEDPSPHVGTGPCVDQNVDQLNEELDKLRDLVLEGDFLGLKSKLVKWNGYVGDSESASFSYLCSDLDYLSRKTVHLEESVFDDVYGTHSRKLYMTLLELALHLTRGSNQRALTKAMNTTTETVSLGEQSEHLAERVKITRLLLEKGFSWGSGDLVCHVVPEENGYRQEIRSAFARTILHDLVLDPKHLTTSHFNFLRKHCGGKGMDGVVWILALAPGAFTLLGLLHEETILMEAAQQDPNPEAYINFPELINMYQLLNAPLTTVDLHGWNAEMLAAGALKRENVYRLKETTLKVWQQSTADFAMFFLPAAASDWLLHFCIFLSTCNRYLWGVAVVFFLCASLFVTPPPCVHRWRQYFQHCQCTFLGVEMALRVAWLVAINMAFLSGPPLLAICWNRRVSPFQIPSVSKWNPLSETWYFIIVCCSLGLLWYLYNDGCEILEDQGPPRKANPEDPDDDDPAPEDRYQDPTCHLTACLCIFSLMCLLMSIYLQIVVRPLEMDLKKTGLWFGSILVQVKLTLKSNVSDLPAEVERVCGSEARLSDKFVSDFWKEFRRWASCMVTPYNPKMWKLLKYATDREAKIQKLPGGKPIQVRWSHWEFWLRFAMSYFSNGLYTAIIVHTLPLWLSRGGLTDFVLNAFAMVYIVELDDMDGADEDWGLVENSEQVESESEGSKSRGCEDSRPLLDDIE